VPLLAFAVWVVAMREVAMKEFAIRELAIRELAIREVCQSTSQSSTCYLKDPKRRRIDVLTT
jgi:hypothetical protein